MTGRWIKLKFGAHREYAIQKRKTGPAILTRAVLQDDGPLLLAGKKCGVVGHVPLYVPGIRGVAQRLGCGAEIDVCISDIDAGGAIELNAGILAEVHIENHLVLGARAIRGRRELKILSCLGK